MQYILLLMFTLLFTACNTSTLSTNPQPKETISANSTEATTVKEVSSTLPVTNQDTDEPDLKISEANSIVGEYTLKRGIFSHGDIHQEIKEAYLVIEELEVDNYGYYYVTIIDKMEPETYSGIFYEKGGKFLQKVIYNDESSDMNETTKSQIQTIDNIKITYDENILKILIDSNKKMTTIWDRADGVASKSEALKKSLQDAQYQYIKYYKEKCIAAGIACAEKEYTPVND